VNNLQARVSAFCLAMSDAAKIDYLNLGAFGISFSHHDFAENTWVKDMNWGKKKWTKKNARLRQGCVSSTLDTLVDSGVLPVPDHIKIDVDGLEHRVITGCLKTLQNPGLKTVLVELDFRTDHASAIIDLMASLGWSYSVDQIRAQRDQILTVDTIERWRRDKVLNYIFFREDKYARVFEDFLTRYQVPASWTHPAVERESWNSKIGRIITKSLPILRRVTRRSPN
jgi:FkbM family methyltransferase